MLTKYVLTTALAVGSAAALAAQAPASSPQQPASANETKASEMKQPATLTGCVYREQDVPGRAPNVAERVGILEDYILAEVKPAAEPGGAPGAVGTSGTQSSHSMYKLELEDDEKLGALVGKRVEVIGQIDAEPGDAVGQPPAATSRTDQVLGRDAIDLAEFEVSSIRAIEGTCPATPATR